MKEGGTTWMEFVEPIRDRKKIEAMIKVLRGSNLRDHVLFTLGIILGLESATS